MAIEDITKQPLGLLKLSQLVLLAISLGCVFGPANGWWYYVGATLIAAFLNTIIMLLCYYWKQSFESTFLELSYTTYFVVALFISAILLFVQPHYAEAPWQTGGKGGMEVLTTISLDTTTFTSTTEELSTTEIVSTTEMLSTTPPPTTPPPTTPPPTLTTKPPTTATTPGNNNNTGSLKSLYKNHNIAPKSLSIMKEITTPSMLPTTESKSSPTTSITSTQSTSATKPPEPHYKDGTWIAGGVFCLFLSLAYSAELYFLTRRLVYSSG